MMDTTTRVGSDNGLPEKPLVHRTKHIGMLDDHSVALYVDGDESPIIVRIEQQAILGRNAPNSPVQPQVDLTPSGAFDKGVSRLHAVIRRTNEGELVLQDMGSSNGTLIKGTRLTPGVSQTLASGDRFRLGQLDVEIYFGKGGEAVVHPEPVQEVPSPPAIRAEEQVASPGVASAPTRQLGQHPPVYYEGSAPINPKHVFSEMGLLTEDIINYLNSLPGCEITLTLEIKARKSGGFDEKETQTVTDRSRILRFAKSQFKSE